MADWNKRAIITCVVVAAAMIAVCHIFGCAATVGSDFKQDMTGVKAVNGSPVTLAIQDKEKIGTANGVGPARFTSITGGEIQTLQSGTVPRDLFLTRKTDGTWQVNLSSGTDISAEGVKVDPRTGAVSIAKFGTLTSTPLAAHNAALAPLVDYWKARDDASRQVLIRQIEAAENISTDLKAVLIQALTGL